MLRHQLSQQLGALPRRGDLRAETGRGMGLPCLKQCSHQPSDRHTCCPAAFTPRPKAARHPLLAWGRMMEGMASSIMPVSSFKGSAAEVVTAIDQHAMLPGTICWEVAMPPALQAGETSSPGPHQQQHPPLVLRCCQHPPAARAAAEL